MICSAALKCNRTHFEYGNMHVVRGNKSATRNRLTYCIFSLRSVYADVAVATFLHSQYSLEHALYSVSYRVYRFIECE